MEIGPIVLLKSNSTPIYESVNSNMTSSTKKLKCVDNNLISSFNTNLFEQSNKISKSINLFHCLNSKDPNHSVCLSSSVETKQIYKNIFKDLKLASTQLESDQLLQLDVSSSEKSLLMTNFDRLPPLGKSESSETGLHHIESNQNEFVEFELTNQSNGTSPNLIQSNHHKLMIIKNLNEHEKINEIMHFKETNRIHK